VRPAARPQGGRRTPRSDRHRTYLQNHYTRRGPWAPAGPCGAGCVATPHASSWPASEGGGDLCQKFPRGRLALEGPAAGTSPSQRRGSMARLCSTPIPQRPQSAHPPRSTRSRPAPDRWRARSGGDPAVRYLALSYDHRVGFDGRCALTFLVKVHGHIEPAAAAAGGLNLFVLYAASPLGSAPRGWRTSTAPSPHIIPRTRGSVRDVHNSATHVGYRHLASHA